MVRRIRDRKLMRDESTDTLTEGGKIFPHQITPCHGWGMSYGSTIFTSLHEARYFVNDLLDISKQNFYFD